MPIIHSQYTTNLEEIEDIRRYDEAMKNDTKERIPMKEAFRMIEENRKNKSQCL